jgi:hypothetical protein
MCGAMAGRSPCAVAGRDGGLEFRPLMTVDGCDGVPCRGRLPIAVGGRDSVPHGGRFPVGCWETLKRALHRTVSCRGRRSRRRATIRRGGRRASKIGLL